MVVPEAGETSSTNPPTPDHRVVDACDTINPARLLGVVAAMQRQINEPPEEQLQDLKRFEAQLARSITPAGVVLQGEEKQTVEVVARVVHSVLQQPDIDEGVKRRLWRLTPPLVMLALQDDDYLQTELEAARHRGEAEIEELLQHVLQAQPRGRRHTVAEGGAFFRLAKRQRASARN